MIPSTKSIAGYLYIFLLSPYGQAILKKYTYGAVISHIDDTHVRQIARPLLKNREVQKQINDLALDANEKRYEAYKLEQQALRIMDNEVIYAK